MEGKSSTGSSQAAQDTQRSTHGHDTHATPPHAVFEVFRRYQRMSDAEVNSDLEVVDFSRGLTSEQKSKLPVLDTITSDVIQSASRQFLTSDGEAAQVPNTEPRDVSSCDVYGHVDFPGLRLFPNLLPPEVQVTFVDRLLHRELSVPLHRINVHEDYNLVYPPQNSTQDSQRGSFFTLPPTSPEHTLTPLSPDPKRRPIQLNQFLRKRWRWLTLGAQYDWPTRKYPPKDKVPTEFPADIAALAYQLFPPIKAESGVVLVYGPKDYMPVHRDVSEFCEQELCSFTLGCDGLFIVALDQDCNGNKTAQEPSSLEGHKMQGDDPERPQKTAVIRVRSGDVVTMAGPTRWCWHAMPKVIAGTCPEFLSQWPLKPGMDRKHPSTKAYSRWKGYMTGKRINISCRQVYD